MKRAGFMAATMCSVLLSAPLTALSFLGWRRLGVPFIPFDLFDAISRLLPGPIITGSIESMVGIIRALRLGATSAVAKTAEQAIAIAVFFVLFVLAGILFLIVFGKGEGHSGFRLSLVLAAMTVLLAFPVARGRSSQVSPFMGICWTLLLLIIWSLCLAWVRKRLFVSKPVQGAPVRVDPIDRRRVLIRLGEASALITFAGAVVGALPGDRRPEKGTGASENQRWSQTHTLPNSDDPVKPAPGTRPEFTPLESHYRIDINTVPPAVKEANWKLRVSGLVEKPMEFTLAEIRKYEAAHQFVTLACISNLIAGDLIGTTRWTGVSMQRILPEVRPLTRATHIKIRSADDFFEIVSLETIRKDPRVMLAYEWDGVPLTTAHGFPLRIYIPDRYGMKQPKWIESIEFIDHSEEGYWVKRGWDAEARMKSTSVIDTMSSNMMIGSGNGQSMIPLGGIAHAGARGISRVQVQVDGEPWRDAQLRKPLSELTWVVWRFDWPFKAGKHTFAVRCFEGNGTPQPSVEASPHPSGATGLHHIDAML